MVKKVYTKEQKEFLLKNRNVAKCGKGVITYATEFKIKAVKQYQEEYMPPKEIFMEAGFDIDLIGKNKPKNCLERWSKIYRRIGAEGLLEASGKRGRPKKPKDKSDKDKIERLELEIEYLKAENDFLAKLRAKRNQSSSLARNTE